MATSPSTESALQKALAGLDPKEVASLLDQLAGEKMKTLSRARSPEYKASLVSAYHDLMTTHPFSPGDLVRWKPALKNKRRPEYDVPAIVVEVLDEPVRDREQGAGSAYFREPLDLAIGLLDDDDDFVILHVDSRRIEPF